ncbi:hypothetical protein A1Q2_05489 [Trichosporon asahii var. asahii CBS 8904]|uniref:PRKR-interacting protein 1 n=1 Tax=Trichosporon asahii var. asahii (strain CBS 8904) TaxID=1220162 RepID=K1VH65_TRIAC|nr:hypothetical protein A1Q2_05489 [Trichosporon asahii var. asahii CBS 8904]
MPVLPTDSPSPERYERSPTPDPVVNGEGPSKRPRLTTDGIQRYKVSQQKRGVAHSPQGPFASEILARMPKDIVKSVSGSAAAAGSGEFHVYKNSRRREFERVKLMEEQQRAKEFLARQAARDAEAEAKTAKNRAKRLKRKAARRGGSDSKKDAATTSRLEAAPYNSEPAPPTDTIDDAKPVTIATGVEIKVLDDD